MAADYGRIHRLLKVLTLIQDERMTAALLDRFTHRCTIIELNGESHRFRECTGTSAKRAVGKERTTVKSEKPVE